jgi:hypothetical protein
MVRTTSKKKTHNRTSISLTLLEAKINKAVKAEDACGEFVGVIVQRSGEQSIPGKANWTIKGIKFGKADRNKASRAVTAIVERLQLLFDISDVHPID